MHLLEIWVIAIVVFVALEAATYQLVSLWFALGASGALAAMAMGYGFDVQMGVFLIISFILLVSIRPISVKLLKNKGLRTNVDGLIGKEVYITETVNNIKASGKGKINGMTWTVRSVTEDEIAQGSTAVIEKIEGVKLIVKERVK